MAARRPSTERPRAHATPRRASRRVADDNPVDAYARDVVAGRVPAGQYHRLACARHLRDRQREGRRGFPYRFVWEARDAKGRLQHCALRFLTFARKCKHYKGEWAGRLFEPTPFQVFVFGAMFGWRHTKTGLRRFTTAYTEVPRKQGKALALDTPVPTPAGWMRHGDLRPGDRVFGVDGRPRVVEWAGPVEMGPCYRLTVSTGETFIAHARHEWVTQRTWYTGRARGSRGPLPLVETREIAETLRCGARGDYVHRIAVASPLDLPERDLPIPPYTFGAWLGDGTTTNGSITVADEGIVSRMRSEGVVCWPVYQKGGARLYRLKGFTARLRAAGVLGHKRIPPCYLRASYRQRLEVLRGLVDTDGHLESHAIYEIVSCSQGLALDIKELVNSLGLKAALSADRALLNGRDCGPRYRIRFSSHCDQVASLTRKQTSWSSSIRRRSRGRTIVACEPCASVPTSCIQVEGGVYLVGRDFVATHNSFAAAIVALYCTFFEGEPGAEGYVVATKEKQAKIVFHDAKQIVLKSGLTKFIKVNAANLHRVDTVSKFEPLGSDSDSTDGLNPYSITVDEMHAWKQRGLLDVMESATGARRSFMNNQITTAGSDLVSVCGDQHNYACQILDGVLDDDPSTLSFFAIITHADPKDDPWAEATWRKANPHYGISVKPDDIQKLAAKAQHMPSAAAEFKQKRLNLWVNADQPWLSLEGWQRGQTTGWSLKDLAGEECWIGVDLSSKIDLTALVCVFPPTATRPGYRLVPFVWTPEDTIDDRAHRDRAPYGIWADAGHLIRVPGSSIKHRLVQEKLVELRDQVIIRGIGFDPWHVETLRTDLVDDDGFSEELLVDIPQTFAGLSAASRRFEAEVLAGQMDAGASPVMAWCVSNTVVQTDGKDNIQPIKKKSRGRIDPVVAANIGLAVYLRMPQSKKKRKPSVYQTRGAVVVTADGVQRLDDLERE